MAYKKVVESLEAEKLVTVGGVNREGIPYPKKFEGYFLGTTSHKDEKKKSGLGYKHIFLTKEGKVGVWGKTNLDKVIKNAVPGRMTLIEQSGTKKVPMGSMLLYTVSQDDENVIDVSSYVPASQMPSESSAAPAEEVNYEEPAGEEALFDDEEPLDEAPVARPQAPRAPVAAPNAAQQARAQALLNRTRK